MEEKFVTVTIAPDGRSMKVEADNFHGQGCGAIMEAFNSMGTVTHEEHKPEYYEANHNHCGLSVGR